MGADPYVVLGLSRDSGPPEWKKAYRRLAMRWHPDRNPDPAATERFKAINAAYEALLTVDPENGPKSESPDDAPEPAAAAPEPEDEAPRAADIRLNLELSLEEGAAGCRRTVRYVRGKPCPTCEGSGEAGIAKTRFCTDCHGSGRVRGTAQGLSRCAACDGRGLFTERICQDCGGSGRETADVELDIAVPPGMLPGDELRLAGQGEAGDAERQPGHLFLTVVLRDHPVFRLDGRDLRFRMPVSALALLAGAEIELPSLGGAFAYELAPGSAECRDIRLAGRGYPGRGRNPAGDLVGELTPVFPARLGARQRKLLRQAHAALMDDAAEALPEVDAWWRERGQA